MKKNLILMGAAIAALSSCTQSEVLDVPESKAIRFSSFVDKPTRTVTEVTSLTNFYVFGNFGTASPYDGVAYNNESNTQTYYWAAKDNIYKFGAYANGENGKLDDVAFAPGTGDESAMGTLTFSNYEPQLEANKGKDLVAAVANHKVTGSEDTNTKVDLTFKHLLSQVKFTFKTTDADTYTLKIHDIKIDNNAISKTNCTFDGTTITWATDGAEKQGYTYNEIADIAVATALDGEKAPYQGSSVEMVIPQSGTDQIEVTFSATVSGGGLEPKTGNFKANLGYTASGVEGTTDNTWTPGYRYNYIATINADQIDPSLEEKKINFTVKVDTWKDANKTDNGELNKQPGA